jgi:hypothetical protein
MQGKRKERKRKKLIAENLVLASGKRCASQNLIKCCLWWGTLKKILLVLSRENMKMNTPS